MEKISHVRKRSTDLTQLLYSLQTIYVMFWGESFCKGPARQDRSVLHTNDIRQFFLPPAHPCHPAFQPCSYAVMLRWKWSALWSAVVLYALPQHVWSSDLCLKWCRQAKVQPTTCPPSNIVPHPMSPNILIPLKLTMLQRCRHWKDFNQFNSTCMCNFFAKNLISLFVHFPKMSDENVCLNCIFKDQKPQKTGTLHLL